MTADMVQSVLVVAAGAVAAGGGALMRRSGRLQLQNGTAGKKPKRLKSLGTVLSVAGSWLVVVQLLRLVFGPKESEAFTVELTAPRVLIAGISVSSTVVTTWIAMAVLVLLALVLRITVVPRMQQVPRGIQNVLELMVDGIQGYTKSQTHGLGDGLPAYIFSVAALLVASAFTELFGVRAPTADITMTFALSLVTFVLINYYGIKKKGVQGRIRALADPTPVVFPLRVISDIALPISMACRLFGNRLGGMIVMDLLKNALGGAAVGIPSVIGLYFNIFHPLIQAFIFVTLTLTFINEATE